MSQTRPTFYEITRYAENHVMGGDQSASWKKAFPKSKANQKVVHEKASCFHKLKKVQARIAELNGLLKKQSEEEFSLSVSELKQHLSTAIEKGLTDKRDALGNEVAHSISGAVAAVSEINKMDGNHAAVRLAHGGDPDAPPIQTTSTLTEDQALALLKANKIK